MSSPPRILVLGAGIIGMSTAVYLQEHMQCQVKIIAKQYSPMLTTDGAAGLWKPYGLVPGSEERVLKYCRATWQYLWDLMNAGDTGVKVFLEKIYDLTNDDTFQEHFFKDIVLDYKLLEEKDFKYFPNTRKGASYTSIILEGTSMVAYLTKRFLKNGGRLQQGEVKSFEEINPNDFDVVVNCTGLGARTLCNDTLIGPLRGHIIRVKAPWVVSTHINASTGTYIIPRSDCVILGGTTQADDWNEVPNDVDRQKILKYCTELIPSLKDAQIINEWVGLRPRRQTIRVEKEVIQLKNSNGKLVVVHNYGHGGSGLTLFHGSAIEAGQLVQEALRSARPITFV